MNMLILIVSILLSTIFLILSAFHFYWLLGGKFGMNNVLPTKPGSPPVLKPGIVATSAVGLGLFAMSFFYLLIGGVVSFSIPNWMETIGRWGIPIIFLMRAIGDFRYLGLFKKIKETDFAKSDNRIFIPLCFTISFLGCLILLLT
jgi:hypothetical protein